MSVFEMREIGPLFYMLGMRFTRDFEARTTHITQDAYIDRLVDKFHIDLSGVLLLILILFIRDLSSYTGTASLVKIFLFQQLLGLILWLSTNTRIDLAISV